jgi:hypothetical protein
MSPRLVWMVAFAVAMAVIGPILSRPFEVKRAEGTVPRSVKSA